MTKVLIYIISHYHHEFIYHTHYSYNRSFIIMSLINEKKKAFGFTRDTCFLFFDVAFFLSHASCLPLCCLSFFSFLVLIVTDECLSSSIFFFFYSIIFLLFLPLLLLLPNPCPNPNPNPNRAHLQP